MSLYWTFILPPLLDRAEPLPEVFERTHHFSNGSTKCMPRMTKQLSWQKRRKKKQNFSMGSIGIWSRFQSADPLCWCTQSLYEKLSYVSYLALAPLAPARFFHFSQFCEWSAHHVLDVRVHPQLSLAAATNYVRYSCGITNGVKIVEKTFLDHFIFSERSRESSSTTLVQVQDSNPNKIYVLSTNFFIHIAT